MDEIIDIEGKNYRGGEKSCVRLARMGKYRNVCWHAVPKRQCWKIDRLQKGHRDIVTS